MPATVGITTNLEVSGTLTTSTLRSFAGQNLTLGCATGGAGITITTSTLAISFAGATTFAGGIAGAVRLSDETDASDATGTTGSLGTLGGLSVAKAGYFGTVVGVNVLRIWAGTSSVVNGKFNIAIGGQDGSDWPLGSNTTGTGNIAIGPVALAKNTTGGGNIAVGSMFNNTEGNGNVAVGNGLFSNTTGNYNTAVGSSCLGKTVSASSNTSIGYYSLLWLSSGNLNTALGFEAGYKPLVNLPATANNCTFVGAYAASTVDSITNSMALGYQAYISASNQVVIGNTSVTSTILRGTVDLSAVTGTAVSTVSAASKLVMSDASGKIDVDWIPTDQLQIVLRQGSDAERQTIVFSEGEPIWTTDTHQLWVGDGATLGGLCPVTRISDITDATDGTGATGSFATLGGISVAKTVWAPAFNVGSGGVLNNGQTVYISGGTVGSPVDTVFTVPAPISGTDTLLSIFGTSTLLGAESPTDADIVTLNFGSSANSYYFKPSNGHWLKTTGPASDRDAVPISNTPNYVKITRKSTGLSLTFANRASTDAVLSSYGNLYLRSSATGRMFWNNIEVVADAYDNIGFARNESMVNRTSSATGNIGIGLQSLYSLTSGICNVVIGSVGLKYLTTGSNNVAIGYAAGVGLSFNGSNNTLIGNLAGSFIAGSDNVCLGYAAGFNETGSNAFYVDNQLRGGEALGKAGSLLYGTFNATPASQTLRVNGSLSTLGNLTVDSNLTVSGGTAQIGTLRIANGDIYESATNGLAGISFNYAGYGGGVSQFRDFKVYDGKTNEIMSLVGSTKAAVFAGAVTATNLYLPNAGGVLFDSDNRNGIFIDGSGEEISFTTAGSIALAINSTRAATFNRGSANGTIATFLSGNSSNYADIAIGRASAEHWIGVPSAQHNYVTGSEAGDLAVNVSSGKNLIVGVNSAPALTLNATSAKFGGTAVAPDFTLGASGPSVKSSLAARAPAQGIVSTGVAGSTATLASAITGNQTFAVVFDCPASNPSSSAGLLAYGSYFAANTSGLYINSADGALHLEHFGASGTDYRSASISGFVAAHAGKRVSVCGTISSGTLVLYVNGVATSYTETTSGTAPAWGAPSQTTIYLGKLTATSNYWSGYLSLLCLENRALSAAEVLALYERGAVDPSDINAASNTSLVTGDASTFASDNSYWTIVGGGVSITGGKAVIGAAGSALRKATGLVKAGYKYRATFTVSDFTGTGTVALQGQGATLYLSGTADGTFTGEFTAVEDSIQFQSTGNSTCKIDNVLVYALGALLAPDATQAGAGTIWRDISGNNAHITLGTGVSWALPSSGYIGGNLQTAAGRVVKVTPDTTATFNFTTTDHCVVLYYATALVANLQAAATAGTGRHYYVYNRGAGQATITPSSGEKINGDSTFILASQETLELVCTGITGAEWAAF